jgi:chromosomal replication initiator protein DnaA
MLSWRREKKEEPARLAGAKPGTPGSPAASTPSNSSGASHALAPKLSLGECLVQEGIITQGQLEEARAKQKEGGGFLGQVLIDLKSITQPALVSFLVKQCKIPHISLLDYDVSEDLFRLVPKELCRAHYLLPIDKLGSILTLAMVDPLDGAALEKVRQACPALKIKPILCDWNHYETVARKLFNDPAKTVQEVSASSFGLAERRPAAKRDPSAAAQAAVDAAVSAIVQEASTRPASAGRPPAGALQPVAGVSPAPPTAASTGISVDELATRLRDPLRGALQDALAPVVQAQQRLVAAYTAESHRQAAAMPDPKAWLAEVSDGIRAAMQDATLSVLNAHERGAAAPAPDPQWVKEMTDGIRAAVQEAITPVADTLARVKQPAAISAASDPKSLKEFKDGIRGAVQEALSPIAGALAKAKQTAAPSLDVDRLVASLASRFEQSLGELSQEIRAALAVRPSAASRIEFAEVVDRLVAAMQLAMSSQESTIQQLAEAASRAAEAAEIAVKEMRRPEKGKAAARAANVEAFPAPRPAEPVAVSAALGGVDLAAAAEVLDIPGLGLEADERVRASLESDHLLDGYTFDGFLIGPGNAFTIKAARSLAERPSRELTPMYIYGGVGMGKTHLLNAIGNGLHAFNPDLRIGMISGSHFDSSLRTAREAGKLGDFRQRFCHWDTLLFDDIQFLSERAEAQEELFHIFNALCHEGRLLVLTSDCAPDRLEGFDPGLVSRFSSGIVTRLRAPEMEVRVAILKVHAARQRTGVPEEIVRLIAARIPSDVRKLVGALHKVVAFTKLVGEDITAEVANEILNDLGAIEAA